MRNTVPSKVLRLAVVRNPPDAMDDCLDFPTFSATAECIYPGWCLEVVKFLADSMNVTIEPLVLPYASGEADWGNLDDYGNWSGVLGHVQRDEVDTACLMYQRTKLREQYFTFANSVMAVRQFFITQQRQETMTSKVVKLISAFDMKMWAIMIAVTLFQMVFLEFVLRFESVHILRKHWHPMRTAWTMVQLVLKQREEVVHEIGTMAGNATMVIWSIGQCVMVVELYRVLLLAKLLNPAVIPPFSSTDQLIELIATKQYRLVNDYFGLWYFDELRHSNASHYVNLRAAIVDNPIVLVNSITAVFEKLDEGNYIYADQEDGTVSLYLKTHCHLTAITKGMPQKSSHFVFRQNSSWLPIWNEAIVLTQSFQQHVFRKYFETGHLFGKLPHCDNENAFEQKPEGSPLTSDNILGPLLMLAIGLVIAFVVITIECCYKRRLLRKMTISSWVP